MAKGERWGDAHERGDWQTMDPNKKDGGNKDKGNDSGKGGKKGK